MAASYPSAVKTFTAKVDGPGNTISASHVNDLQDEIAALEAALLTTGLAHNLFPDATSRTLGSSAKPWGMTFINALAYIGDTANAQMTSGLTLNQGAADDEILTLKSSDVDHGMTTFTETDTYAYFAKQAAASGGLLVRAFTEANLGITLQGFITTADTTKSTAAVGCLHFFGALKSGTANASLGANANIAAFADNGTVRFILDADGDSHQDVGTAWTNFDDADDIARLDAVAVSLAREGDPLRAQFVEHFEQHRAVIEAMPGKPLVSFNADGHHFVNMSRLTMLLTGAVRQVAREHAQIARALVSAGVISHAQLEAA